MANAFTFVFLAALVLATATRIWLARRQIGHVLSHRAAVPPAFSDAIGLAAHQKAADYTAAKTRLGMVEVLVHAVLVLALTLGSGIQALSGAWAAVLPPGSLSHGTALILSVVALQGAVGLPLTLWRIFVVEERFGFNRMTWPLFASDLLKQVLVGLALGVPLILAVLWLMARSGALWWLYAWGVWVAFSAFVMIIVPPVILPLFNKFTPLQDPELAARVRALLQRCGFRSRGLYLMDGSRRSSHGNAFFIGFGATKRIVLFDTLVSRLHPGEVEAVLAHELGHYRLHHVVKGLAISAAMSFAGLWILGEIAGRAWFYAGLGVTSPGAAAALVLFFLVLPEFTFFFHPLSSLYSRSREFAADGYAAAHTDGAELVSALVKLYKDNAATLTPDPLHSAFYDSHPPAATRISRLRTT